MRTYKNKLLYIFLFTLVIAAAAKHNLVIHAEDRTSLDNLKLTITAIPTIIRQRLTTVPDRESLRTTIMPSVNPTSIVATIRASTCASIITSVKGREASLIESTSRLIQRLSSLTDSVHSYYVNNLVPDGKTISTYNDMLANVSTKKASAEAALTTLKTNVNAFTCQTGDINTQIATYRSDMQKLVTSVREYTAAVKILVAAVRPIISVSIVPTR